MNEIPEIDNWIILNEFEPLHDKDLYLRSFYGTIIGRFNRGTFGFIIPNSKSLTGVSLLHGCAVHSWQYVDEIDRLNCDNLKTVNHYELQKAGRKILEQVKFTWKDKLNIFWTKLKSYFNKC